MPLPGHPGGREGICSVLLSPPLPLGAPLSLFLPHCSLFILMPYGGCVHACMPKVRGTAISAFTQMCNSFYLTIIISVSILLSV